jgi:hypothetical protein
MVSRYFKVIFNSDRLQLLACGVRLLVRGSNSLHPGGHTAEDTANLFRLLKFKFDNQMVKYGVDSLNPNFWIECIILTLCSARMAL